VIELNIKCEITVENKIEIIAHEMKSKISSNNNACNKSKFTGIRE